MAETAQFTIQVTVHAKAVDLLQAESGLAKSRIKDAMQKGAVWHQRGQRKVRLRRGSAQVEAGDRLTLYYNEQLLQAQAASPELLADHHEYSIWFKPPGLMSSGSRFADHHAISRQVQLQLDRPTFVVHRLDRYTRGLMVLAHRKTTAAHLAQQFRQRKTHKVYQAVVTGQLQEAISVELALDNKAALSHISPIKHLSGQTWVEVQIDTGRKHQIRRHLAHIGHPVVGDVLYGDAQSGDLQLAAVNLGFECPVLRKSVSFDLPRQHRLF